MTVLLEVFHVNLQPSIIPNVNADGTLFFYDSIANFVVHVYNLGSYLHVLNWLLALGKASAPSLKFEL